ncbi:hypothetical protein LguiB_013316 [Lonicera macranthoides]
MDDETALARLLPVVEMPDKVSSGKVKKKKPGRKKKKGTQARSARSIHKFQATQRVIRFYNSD